ncbi:MAG: hypothetical protein EXS11_04245 [Gemmataceae bacterium]|nr:hypothetical protein [Gemmataceae bacterium]
MIDILKTVGHIRELLRSRNGRNAADLEATARDFADAFQLVMTRLDLCQNFLNNGYRSEALHLSQIEPEILEFFQLSQFEERQKWDLLCTEEGYPVAGQPSENALINLNRAYSEDEGVRDLLQEYRALALTNASLLDRITVLRAIHQQDPNNPAIQRNLQDFERLRQKDLESEAIKAHQTGSWQKLLNLSREVNGIPWINSPPESIVAKIDKLAEKAQDFFNQQELRQSAEEVKKAYLTLQFSAVEIAFADFDNWCEMLKVSLEDPISKQLNPVRNWLAREVGNTKRLERIQQQIDKLNLLFRSKNDYVWDKSLLQDADNLAANICKLTGVPLDPHLAKQLKDFKNQIEKEMLMKMVKPIAWILGTVIILALAIGIPMYLSGSAKPGKSNNAPLPKKATEFFARTGPMGHEGLGPFFYPKLTKSGISIPERPLA